MEKPTHSQAPAFILGVDVSKDSLDICLLDSGGGRELSHKTKQPLGLQAPEGLAQAARLRGGA
ncbi:hypothetical protein [Rufibacter sp. XAAS-G3-1]|uniref:hypothetical protein n=1 Tax=Rufibacter sp. XAAS-G3-1 TaxID=2729134 RepID=UPI0015E71F41|nr:hypothetical protein [Rufibacter sp. XAAS-G3-1]